MEKMITFTTDNSKNKIGIESFKLMQLLGKRGLEYYNQGDNEKYNIASENYRASRNVAKFFGIDVSKYPETLEELIK
jgi:hypothetical protein